MSDELDEGEIGKDEEVDGNSDSGMEAEVGPAD